MHITTPEYIKPRPNGCNMSTQHIATLLRAFGHPVVTCCDMLGVVGSSMTECKKVQTKFVF